MAVKLTLREKKAIEYVVEFLGRAESIDREINLLLLDKEKMRASLYGRSPEGGGGGKGSASDSLGKAVVKMLHYEEKIDSRIDELVTMRSTICNAIDLLSDQTEREVMRRKYLLYQKVHTKYDKEKKQYIAGIADTMHYSIANVYKIHDRAALKLASKLAFSASEKK